MTMIIKGWQVTSKFAGKIHGDWEYDSTQITISKSGHCASFIHYGTIPTNKESFFRAVRYYVEDSPYLIKSVELTKLLRDDFDRGLPNF